MYRNQISSRCLVISVRVLLRNCINYRSVVDVLVMSRAHVCVCVCVCVCEHACERVRVRFCCRVCLCLLRACLRANIRTCVHVCVYLCVYVPANKQVCVRSQHAVI